MVCQEKKGTVEEVFVDSLSSLHEQRVEFLTAVNRTRWNRYENRGEVFGMKYGEVFPSDEWLVPRGDQFNIVRENATYGWANCLWDAISDADTTLLREREEISSWNPDTSVYPTFEQQYLHLKPEDYQVKEAKDEIAVLSPEDSILFIISVDTDVSHLGDGWIEMEFDSDISESETENGCTVTIHYEYDSDDDPDVQSSINDHIGRMQAEQSRRYQIALTIIVASGTSQVGQIEAPEGDDEFEEFFEELNLFYEQVYTACGRDIYLISHSERGENKIQRYLNQDDITLKDYISLLGYPGDLMYFAGKDETPRYTSEYDRYPSEEFALYLAEDDKIQAEKLTYFALCPYRAPPSEKQARYAIQFGKQVEESIIEFCRTRDEVDADEILEILVNAQNTGIKPSKSIFTSHEWPVDPKKTQNNQNRA